MATVSLEQYQKAMHTQSVTLDWDVAVTYDQDKINALLSERYNQSGGSGLTTQIDIQEKVEDRYGEYYQNYHFNVGSPLISLGVKVSTPGDPTCSLKTPIVSGSIWTSELNDPDTKQDEQQLDADTYWITFYTGLSVLDGSGNYVEGDQNGKTIIFPNGNFGKTDRYIIIDLQNPNTQLKLSVDYPSGYTPPFAMKTDQLLTALKDFFKNKVDRLAYTIAHINDYLPTNGVVDLVPFGFRFATYVVGNTDTAFLTLLIQTRGGPGTGWGLTTDVEAAWRNQWTNVLSVAPVPQSQSASIIINSDFFFEVFIKPGLYLASSINVISIPSSDSVGGVRVECTWPNQTRGNQDYRNSSIPTDWNSWPLDYEWSELHVPGVTYDPNNGTHLTLTFGQSNGFGKPATLRLNWQYKYKSTWTGKQVKRYALYDPEGPMVWMPSTKDYNGSFNTTYTLDKTIELTNLTDEDLSINVGVNPDDWKTDAVPDEAGSIWDQIGQAFGGSYNPGYIPNFVRNTTMGGIGFSFNFGKLRFFSVTNVLLPGEKVIEVNIKNGLGMPRDCVVVGNVVESRSKFKDLKY